MLLFIAFQAVGDSAQWASEFYYGSLGTESELALGRLASADTFNLTDGLIESELLIPFEQFH